jgi:hypothetical protein
MNGALYTTHLLSLDSLLAIVKAITYRDHAKITDDDIASADALRARKALKNHLMNAVENFNREPNDGITYLISKFERYSLH